MAEEPAPSGQYDFPIMIMPGGGRAVNDDTVYVAVAVSYRPGTQSPPPSTLGQCVTTWVSPTAASTAPAQSTPNPLRLRGTEGSR